MDWCRKVVPGQVASVRIDDSSGYVLTLLYICHVVLVYKGACRQMVSSSLPRLPIIGRLIVFDK